MPKIAFLALVLPLLLAPVAPILAQETGSSTKPVNTPFELPESPLDDLFGKWLEGGQIDLKQAAQEGMNKAQKGLEQAAGQALGTAQEALEAELKRQASQAVEATKQKAETYVGGVVAVIKNSVMNIISQIKIFFVDLFRKNAPTN